MKTLIDFIFHCIGALIGFIYASLAEGIREGRAKQRIYKLPRTEPPSEETISLLQDLVRQKEIPPPEPPKVGEWPHSPPLRPVAPSARRYDGFGDFIPTKWDAESTSYTKHGKIKQLMRCKRCGHLAEQDNYPCFPLHPDIS